MDLTSVAGTTHAVVSTVSELPAECIACDAGCGRKNPASVCQGCLSFYYCSRRCQKKHWKRHKSRCRSIALHIDELQQATSDALSVVDCAKECRLSRNAECIICFEELGEKEDRELVVLDPCGHGFCAPCLMKWQREPITTHIPSSSSTQKACPICRANIDDIEEELILQPGQNLQSRQLQPRQQVTTIATATATKTTTINDNRDNKRKLQPRQLQQQAKNATTATNNAVKRWQQHSGSTAN